MMWLKACTHCHGDLVEGYDFDGPVVQCLQCGRHGTSPRQTTRVRAHHTPTRRQRSAPRGFTVNDLGPMIGNDTSGEAWAS